MYCQWLLVLLLSYVLVDADGCVTYTFEEGYLERFNQFPSICSGYVSWQLGYYSALQMDSPHSESLAYITPRQDFTCASSFKFYFQRSGTLEVNVYMNGAGLTDQITVQPYIVDEINGDHTVINSVSLITLNNDFTPGWQEIKMAINVSQPQPAYVTFMGMATEPSSLVLVDSFRYIPSSSDEEECQIYKDQVKNPEEDKKPSHSIFYIKMGIVKVFN